MIDESVQTLMKESIQQIKEEYPIFESMNKPKHKFIMSLDTRERYGLKKITSFQGIDILTDITCAKDKIYLVDMNNYMIEVPFNISTKTLLKLLWLKIKSKVIKK